MKLHLPKKFKTALMAAFATVSFTTVSTASLGAAVFAFAGYQAAAEETATTEESAADKAGQEEIRDNIRALQEEQDEEDESEFTVDPADQGIMERRAKNLERAGDGAASGIAKAAYDAMEAEIFNPAAAAAASSEQQQASASSAELPSDDLGFTSNPYAASSSGNSEPVFEVTPATAATTDFLQETSSEQESTGSSSGSSTPASASGFGGSADSGYSGGGYSPFGLALGSIAPISVGGTGSLFSATLLGANGTNLVWRGDKQGQPVWQNGGGTESSPWSTHPEGGGETQTAFTNGDIALFEYSAEVTVSGTVQTGSLQLNKGTTDAMLVVTINTGDGAKLTADHVVTNALFEQKSFYNKIVKTGTGAIDFTIDDPSFNTILDIQQGTANITFDNGKSFNLYENILGSDSADVVLNFKNGTKTESHVKFRGIDEYNIADGVTLQIDSATAAGGGFILNQAETTINLGAGSTLNSTNETLINTDHLVIKGTDAFALFQGKTWLNHDGGRAVHQLSGSVQVKINDLHLNYDSADATMQIDDASSLHIVNMNAGTYNADESFLHAFKNGGTETDRQKVTIDTLNTNGGATIHLGAASTDQGASEGYQEAGTVDVGTLIGTGTVIFENNVEVTPDTQQCLTEVFKLTNGTGFSGNIRLAADNDGTKDQQKKAVILFQRYDTPYWCDLELQADADYTEYALIMSDTTGLSTNGIQDVGSGVKANSSAMIYSGTISDDKNAECISDHTQRTIYLFAETSGANYQSSFGMSSGIDIEMSGEGSQTFKGDFSEFYGNVVVGLTNPGTELHILNQKAALNIADLTIRGEATLDVKNQNGTNQSAVVKGTLLAKGGPTTAGSGNASVLDGDLTLDSTSILNVSAAGGKGGLDLGGALTINTGAQLSGDDWAAVGELGWFGMYDLAFEVTNVLGLGEDIDWSVGVDATTVFANEGLRANEYYVRYSQDGAGGNGSNVGTVYIYRIPEPTTGTLSLLALAALAARRRRK